MGWWDSGRFFVYGQNLSGRPLSASEVGDVQLFSNLDSTIDGFAVYDGTLPSGPQGLVYKGLLPRHDEDLLGLGIASARFSDHFQTAEAKNDTEIAPSETAIELFYKALVGKSLSLQPDIQYIANPGGQYKDALLPGLRFEAIF